MPRCAVDIERLRSYSLRPSGWAVVPCDLLAEAVRALEAAEMVLDPTASPDLESAID